MSKEGSRYLSSGQLRSRASKRETLRRGLRIVIRLAELAAAVWYIASSIAAAAHSFRIMHGVVDKSISPSPYLFSLIPQYVGQSTLRASPLVSELLANSTSPRNGTLYLHSTTNASNDEDCSNDAPAGSYNAWIYRDAYLRQNLAELTAQTSFHLQFLDDNELIMPVVDCTSTAIAFGDFSAIRVFYLMRNKANNDDVGLLTWPVSTQDYVLPREFQSGAAASTTLTFLNDMRATTVTYHHVMRLGFPFQLSEYQPYVFRERDDESMWVLESVPKTRSVEPVRVVSTAIRVGFYASALTEQMNVGNYNWDFATQPVEAMAVWGFAG